MICSFCGVKIRDGCGILFVRKTGKCLAFCSSRCEKNIIRHERNPRKTKWTVEYRKEKEGKKKK